MPEQEFNPFQAPTSTPPQELRIIHIDPKRGAWIFALLALIPTMPLWAIMRSLHQFRDWNPSWDAEFRQMIFGTTFGMVLSSGVVGKNLTVQLKKPGFGRAALCGLLFGLVWGAAALLGWGWAIAVHGIWVGDLSKFRAEFDLGEVVGGLLALSTFITVPLCLIGIVLIRFVAWRESAKNPR